MVETRAYPITVEAVVDAEAVLTASVYRKYRSASFPNNYYMDILSGQHVVGKHNCVDGTEACPGTDLELNQSAHHCSPMVMMCWWRLGWAWVRLGLVSNSRN